MKEYDVFIAGGAVSGPVAARFCARQGLKTLLVEKAQVPRDKSCSGIQFPYFEKILGETIPPERLCHNTLSRVEVHLPDGRSISQRFPMLNFMRKPFDEWLCLIARRDGAEFRDRCSFKDFEETAEGILIHLETGEGAETIKTRFVIDATGMRPAIRRKLKKEGGFQKNNTGATLNYYFTADGDIEPDKLYQFWNIEYNDAMFAWVYNKTLEDGRDYWVAGTGYSTGIQQRMELFFEYLIKHFHLNNIHIVKKEGFSSTMSLTDEERIWLGERNFLMVGDAAGLIDPTRGVGMDAAALSGRLAARAIAISCQVRKPVSEVYARLMKSLVDQTRRNQQSGILALKTNEELQAYLNQGFLKLGMRLTVQKYLNQFRNAEKQVMLP